MLQRDLCWDVLQLSHCHGNSSHRWQHPHIIEWEMLPCLSRDWLSVHPAAATAAAFGPHLVVSISPAKLPSPTKMQKKAFLREVVEPLSLKAFKKRVNAALGGHISTMLLHAGLWAKATPRTPEGSCVQDATLAERWAQLVPLLVQSSQGKKWRLCASSLFWGHLCPSLCSYTFCLTAGSTTWGSGDYSSLRTGEGATAVTNHCSAIPLLWRLKRLTVACSPTCLCCTISCLTIPFLSLFIHEPGAYICPCPSIML